MSVTIKYNGSNVATVEGGNTATLPVKSKKMATDIIVTVPENKGEVLPDHTESDFTLQLANTATGELGVVYSSTEKVAFDAAPNGEVIETFFDAHFVPSNIKKDVEIFGVTGEYGGGSADDRVKYVTYMDRGAELIKYPVIEGDTARDPVAKGYIEKPTKEPTTTTVYTQDGWSKTDGGAPDSTALQNVTEDRTVYAAFTESVRTYTVNFYDGDTLVHTEQVAYGGSSSYTYTKDGSIFNGWQPAPTSIKADTDCYAQWTDKPSFATAAWSDIVKAVDDGKAEEYFSVGDKRTVAMTDGTNKDIYIIGFNHDTLADGTGKATMTMALEAPFTDVTMTVGDWRTISSTMKTQIMPKFPTEMQASIKTVLKPCDNLNNTDLVEDIAFDFFPLSLEECMVRRNGNNIAGAANGAWENLIHTLGTPYTYFANSYDDTLMGPKGNWLYAVQWSSRQPLLRQTQRSTSYRGVTANVATSSNTWYKAINTTTSKPVTTAFCI